VTSRRSVWNDPALIEQLKAFIPGADDMTHLQAGGADGDLFAKFSEDGHYGGDKGPYGTRQGYYAVTPSGKLLGSTNKRDPAIVGPMLQAALQAYAAMPRAQRLLPEKQAAKLAKQPSDRTEDALYPQGGLVLLEYVRDVPGFVKGTDEVSGNWNLDYVWYSKDEAKALVPAKPAVGAKLTWPSRLSTRLARFHLIDSVNGLRYTQRPLYDADEVQVAELVSTVESVDDAGVHLRIEGQTRAASVRGPARGVVTRLLGKAVWKADAGKFSAFELVAAGTRWGGTGKGKSNDRAGEEGVQGIGFTFQLAGDTPAEHVPPLYVLGYN
jgi:hypothetical protein